MRYSLLAAMLALAPVEAAQAATFVVSGYRTAAGGAGFASMFGTTNAPYRTNQIGFSAATLAQATGGALPVGALVTGVALRLARGQATMSRAITFDKFDISIGSSTRTIGALGEAFSANLGTDTILARSGPLTIAAGSLMRGSPSSRPGNFYNFAFTTPYRYAGGDLLVTMDTHLTSAIAVNSFYLDAFSTIPYSRVDFVSSFDSATPSPTGTAQFFYQPVMQLTYMMPAAVPEPATWATMLLGFGLVGGAARYRRRAVKTVCA